MIRIALISDIHFGKDARSKEYALPEQNINGEIKNAVLLTESAINVLKKQRIDYLFISGDLTSIGSPVEFYYCEKKINEIVEAVGISKEHVIWCTGNHDNDWSIAKLGDDYKTENSDLQEVAKERYGSLAGAIADSNFGYKNIEKSNVLPSSGIYEDDNMIVFVLNSSSKCIRPEIIEHGSLTSEQLEWFKNKLDKYQEDTRWKIIMLHHHPFNYAFPSPSFDVSQLEEGSELCDLAGKNGVNLVIHGHRHHPRCKTTIENDWKNPVSFICGGSFSVSEHYRNGGEIPNAFHILELSDEVGNLKMFSYEYCSSKGWKEVDKYRDEIPLDRVMYLGKVYKEEDTVEVLSNMVKDVHGMKIYEWNELDDSIKYKSSNVLERIIGMVEEKESCEIKILPLDSIIIRNKECI